MSYAVGIDLGTTYTAAAVWRDGRAGMVDLGTRAAVVPSVVLLRDDGELVVGEAAERRAALEPERVAREFKRRIGDPTPILLGGAPVSADALTAGLLRWVVDRVAEAEGGPASGIAVTHPANWGDYKQDLLRQAIRQAEVGDARTVSEPEAAAIHYAAQERMAAGSVVAVYDLGGGTFDATVLRRTGDGWQILGEPEGIERLGGIDFDEAVFQHVVASLGGAFDQLDPDDSAAAAAVARLRRECVAAKEALGSDTDVSVPVVLPTVQTQVRLTRTEFEDAIRPALVQSVAALRRAIRAAGIAAEDVHAVLLVGGSSRIPLVAELVSAELGRPVAVDAHPKHAVALGAAMVAAGVDPAVATGAPGRVPATSAGVAAATAGVVAATAAGTAADPAAPTGGAEERGDAPDDDLTEPSWVIAGADGEPPPEAPADPDGGAEREAARPRGHRRVLVGALASAVILTVGGSVAMALSGGGGGDADGPPRTSTSSTVASTTTTSAPEPVVAPEEPPVDTSGSGSATTSPPPTEATTTTAPTTTTSSTTTTAPTTTTTAPEVEVADEEAPAEQAGSAAPRTGG